MKQNLNLLLLTFALLFPHGATLAQQRAQMIELLQQLTRLETEIRQLRGEVERLSYENQQLKGQQSKLYVDLDQRLGRLEQELISIAATGRLPTTPTTPLAPTTPPTAAPLLTPTLPTAPTTLPLAATATTLPGASLTGLSALPPQDEAQERQDYKAAFELLKEGKYDEAITAYESFLRAYPSGNYTANAYYWLGEANYVTRRHADALAQFNRVVSLYPDSRKSPDAMLKIGYTYYEMKNTDAARQTLTALTQRFPGTTAARLAENRLQRINLEEQSQ